MSPHLSTTPSLETTYRVKKRDCVVIFILALVFYGMNVDFWLYGDSALYADYSLRRTFTDVTLHLGYYLLVIGTHALTNSLFGIPIQESMAWLNVVAGATTLCVAYLLALELIGDRKTAMFCVAVFGLSGRIFYNATSSEVYMTQTLFVLLSFVLFCRERLVWSALCGTIAILISPLSVFAFLFFPVYDYQRAGCIRWRVLLRLAGIALLCYAPYLLIYGHELLWGRRGLLTIREITPLDPVRALTNFPLYLFKHYTALNLLFVPALLAARRDGRILALTLAVSVPHLYIILKLPAEDNVFLLNTDFFSALLIAIGAMELTKLRLGRFVGPGLLAAHLTLFIVSGTIFTLNHHRGYAAELRDISERYQRNRKATIIADWGTAAAFAFYARDSAATDLLSEPAFQRLHDIENDPPSDPKLKSSELLVLDRWNPTALNRMFSSAKRLRRLREANGIRERAQRQLNLRCTLLEEKTNRLFRCEPNAETMR